MYQDRLVVAEIEDIGAVNHSTRNIMIGNTNLTSYSSFIFYFLLFLGTAVTAYGRIMIAEKILQLEGAALYADTDSVMFIDHGQPLPFEQNIVPVVGDFVEGFVSLHNSNYFKFVQNILRLRLV